MKLTVTGRRLALSDADRAEIARRVGRLDRILNDNAVSASAVISRERAHHSCELAVHARGGHMLVGLGQDRHLGVAVGLAAGKVAQQAGRLKERWKGRRGAKAASLPPPAPAGREAPAPPRVIRSRSYAVKPMTVDDAVLLLTSGPHPVLVFRHPSTDAVAVVYKRPDGDVGLIEPGA